MASSVLSDLASLAMTVDFGLGCLEAYLRLNSGQQIPLPWPRGWSLVLQELEADDDYGPEDIKRLGQYLCCETRLTFVGRVVTEPVLTHGQRKKTLIILTCGEGQVFCYVEEDCCLYYVARSFLELQRVGLRAVDAIYCPRYMRSSAVKRGFRGLLRAWDISGDALSRYVTRHHGDYLHLPYPEGACLRLCNLKCFETSSGYGFMLRSLRQHFGKQVICLGSVDLRGEVPSSPPLLRWPATRVPVVLADAGRVFCFDLVNLRYIRLADDLAAFMCLGLRQLLDNRRFTGEHELHDSIPECPRGRQHDD
ncbi:tegument protein UL24 [Cercopithecine betaherpesvirus 5]|uniref:Tegument protein UL24 n=1 Tax=Simian cytomegalovirus (strain Colburn) TaxID=50292 RepID=G8XTT1_SCMVC|nr:tegument protein UL24 [Cercopithecine betaherpesvirus 5]